MAIKTYILLYIYYAFIFVWASFSITALYHMLKFGFKNLLTFLSIIIYISISVFILSTSYFYISQLDWDRELIDFSNSSSAELLWE